MKLPPLAGAVAIAGAAVAAGFVLGGAKGGHPGAGSTVGHDAPVHDAGAPPAWSYSGATGPTRWASLDKSWGACGKGLRQSPVNVEKTTQIGLDDLAFRYVPEALELVDTGHALQANATGASTLVLDGRTFALASIEVHTPSQHLVHDRPAAAELDLVHRSDDGEVAIVAVLVEEGTSNPVLDPILGALPKEAGAVSRPAGPFDVSTLLPKDRRAVRYEGSLTAPPCTEGVRWAVVLDPLAASRAQVDALRERYPANARPVQERNDRSLLEDVSGPEV